MRQSARQGSEQQETPQVRVGPGIARAIRDVYPPDAAGDERLDGLIDQLRDLKWPPSPDPH